MLAAERRGKAQWIDQETAALAYAEDVVTSTVFGLLSYLPTMRGLGHLLQHLLPDEAPYADVHMTFWPPSAGTEPDLAMEARHTVVVFEMKLDAPFGPQQLGREWLWLRNRVRERSAETTATAASIRSMLVVVTRRPLSNAELSRRVAADLLRIGSAEPAPSDHEVRGLTWHQLAEWMLERDSGNEEAYVAVVLDDLDYFLRSRGLRGSPFEAWPTPTRAWQACPNWYGQCYFDSTLLRVVASPIWHAARPDFYQRYPG